MAMKLTALIGPLLRTNTIVLVVFLVVVGGTVSRCARSRLTTSIESV